MRSIKTGDEVTVSDATTTTIYKIKKLDKSNLVYSTSYDTIINSAPLKLELEFTCVLNNDLQTKQKAASRVTCGFLFLCR